MDKFAALQALQAVIETGSFQAASSRLGVAKSVVSRRISLLEEQLSTRLLHRTTRSLSLTDEGHRFYQRSLQILADLEDAEMELSLESSEVRGKLKLAAPLSFGISYLSNAINDFLLMHPAIELEMDLNDRTINLVEEGFDMAVRIGELEDSSLVARRIGTMRSLTCASEAYIKSHGKPQHPDDLKHHVGLQYSNISYRQQWLYEEPGGQQLSAQPQIRIRANNGEALAQAAIHGLGIVKGPSFILSNYVRDGSLLRLLDDYQHTHVGIYAIYPPGRLLPHRVRVFTDFLADQFGDSPQWDSQVFF